MDNRVRILGIDPGVRLCGYACIQVEGEKRRLIEAGVFRTEDTDPIEKRLDSIARDTRELLDKFRPEIVAVEDLYSHYAHPRTAILMGHARGVILQTVAEAGIRIKSFSATRIKNSITGSGRASKQQVQKTIRSLLALEELPKPADVADAIAVALCCADHKEPVVQKKK